MPGILEQDKVPTMTWSGARAETCNSGFSIYELVVAVFIVFSLVLGFLILVTSEGESPEGGFFVSPYRAMYAKYINNRLSEWTSVILSYESMNGGLPGDSSRP
ncbi:MAG: hypothetical protein AB1896_23580, partial [Thermodesulfobacteriota bacterium]